MKRLFILTACLSFTVAAILNGQQVSDTSYNPVISNPAYAAGKGPVVYIDEGHNNCHTKEGRDELPGSKRESSAAAEYHSLAGRDNGELRIKS